MMFKKDRSRKKYPSDLTDEQWTIVEPLIPPAKQRPRGGRPRQVDMRDVLNTLFSLNRSGCQWDSPTMTSVLDRLMFPPSAASKGAEHHQEAAEVPGTTHRTRGVLPPAVGAPPAGCR